MENVSKRLQAEVAGLKGKLADARKELAENQKEMKVVWAYRDAVQAFATTKESLQVRTAALKRFKDAVHARDWDLVGRIGGLSGNILATGGCKKCGINLVGPDNRPDESTMPCCVNGCPFEGGAEVIAIPWDNVA